MKTYTIVVKITNGDTVEDMEDFIYGEFTRVDITKVSECGNKYRIILETGDDFSYGYFEDCMDNAGYDTEFLELHK